MSARTLAAVAARSLAAGSPERMAWIVCALGLLGAGLAWLLAPAGLPYAWLAALVTWIGWPLGSLALLLVHALTGGRWGDAVRPGLLAGLVTMPLVLPLVVPVLLALPSLYLWGAPGAILPNAWYLNTGFFAVRGVLYLVVWLGLAWAVQAGRARQVAVPGLLLLAITVTFAAVDLTMSLQPRFVSSIYGMLTGAGAVVLALAAAILLGGAGGRPDIRNDVGKLLFALVLLWAYLNFMQVVIVWQNDLTEQVPWYKLRTRGGWDRVMVVVVVGNAVLPLAVLLSVRARRSPRALAAVALLLVAMAGLRAWWTVLPEAPGLPWPAALACLLGVCGAGAAVALGQVRRQARQGAAHA